jgi:hypothetical protein
VNAGERDIVKGGGGEEGERERSVQGRCDYTTAFDFQVDPERRGFSRHESDFALQAHVERVNAARLNRNALSDRFDHGFVAKTVQWH